eukprot:6183230-Pleurochrysis_carterae.AAC.5
MHLTTVHENVWVCAKPGLELTCSRLLDSNVDQGRQAVEPALCVHAVAGSRRRRATRVERQYPRRGHGGAALLCCAELGARPGEQR